MIVKQKKEQKIVLYGKDGSDSNFVGAQILGIIVPGDVFALELRVLLCFTDG